MANRFIGGSLTSNSKSTSAFSSRSSAGTYFDKNGVLVTATSNQPRLNYNFVNGTWTQPTVLIEPETTNIVSYSQDFSQASYWSPNNSTIGSAAGTTPDGTNTAFKIQENTSNTLHGVEQQLGDTNGRAYTLSIFAKAAERSWLILDNTHQGVANYRNWFNLSTGTTGTKESGNIHTSMTPVGNGWYRCSVTRPAGTLGQHRICIYASTGDGTITYTGTSGSGILIWGCQLEYQLGMTSYISSPSTGVGTRAADVVGSGPLGVYGLEDRQNNTAIDDQFTVQSFTATGTTTWTAPADVTSVEVLVVAGGGSGEGDLGGGGGGGGVVYNTNYTVVPGITYPVIVGSGGVATATYGTNTGRNGGNSQFGTITAIGGGSGGYGTAGANTGGSGGGGGQYSGIAIVGAPGIAGQGYPGGNAVNENYIVGGGGGAGGPGGNGNTTTGGGKGGPGLYFNISGTSTAYAGGGGGAVYGSAVPAGTGGVGGGGNATGTGNTNPGGTGANGTANTGGGGGGGGVNSASGTGGSGIVIIKYKRTPRQLASTSNAAVVVQKFTVSNTWTVPAGVTQVEALVVAGGGGGGAPGGSGGGAGGLLYNSAITVTPGTAYNVLVGDGGIGGVYNSSPGGKGGTSIFGGSTELVTNGTFPNTTSGWTTAGGTLTTVTRGSGYAAQYVTTGNTPIYQLITVTSGQTYTLSYLHISGYTAAYISTNTNSSGSIANPGDQLVNNTYASVTFTAAASSYYVIVYGIGSNTHLFTNVSVRQGASVALGGGGGGGNNASAVNANGGSGAGAAPSYVGGSAGTGVAGQGFAGGASGSVGYGGGGGAGGVGNAGNDVVGGGQGGNGGPGLPFNITGNLEYYAGGGGGGVYTPTGTLPGYGGIGGGGSGSITNVDSQAGAANTGGGGGGKGGGSGVGGNGGSGVVILRYRVPQVATFLDSGTWTCPAGVTSVQALIVAGGGGGGYAIIQSGGGGGGAGGVVYDNSIPVTPGQTYSVVVGQGAVGSAVTAVQGYNGSNSSFANLIAIGGGGGGSFQSSPYTSRFGIAGGSGGGGAGNILSAPGGAGTYGQGNSGGTGYDISGADGGAGGGGAGGVGLDSDNGGTTAGVGNNGGVGLQYSISGTATYYAGGGGGGSGNVTAGIGGLGGGGAGGTNAGSNGFAGTQNTGGGGGGASAGTGGTGGSGIVIIRWIGG